MVPFPNLHAVKRTVEGMQCFRAWTVFWQGSRRYWGKIRTLEVTRATTALSVTTLWEKGDFSTLGSHAFTSGFCQKMRSRSWTKLTNVSGFFKPESSESPIPKQTAGFLAMFPSPCAVGESTWLTLQGLGDPMESIWLSVFSACRTDEWIQIKVEKPSAACPLWLHGHSC